MMFLDFKRSEHVSNPKSCTHIQKELLHHKTINFKIVYFFFLCVCVHNFRLKTCSDLQEQMRFFIKNLNQDFTIIYSFFFMFT